MLTKLCVLVALFATGISTTSISLRGMNEYYISTQQSSFVQAWANCKNIGLKFISLPTKAQNDAVASALSNIGASTGTFWIGGIYLRSGVVNKWYWVNGEEDFNYTNWVSTPSLAATGDYCVVLSYNATSKAGTWTYGTCSVARYYICQY